MTTQGRTSSQQGQITENEFFDKIFDLTKELDTSNQKCLRIFGYGIYVELQMIIKKIMSRDENAENEYLQRWEQIIDTYDTSQIKTNFILNQQKHKEHISEILFLLYENLINMIGHPISSANTFSKLNDVHISLSQLSFSLNELQLYCAQEQINSLILERLRDPKIQAVQSSIKNEIINTIETLKFYSNQETILPINLTKMLQSCTFFQKCDYRKQIIERILAPLMIDHQTTAHSSFRSTPSRVTDINQAQNNSNQRRSFGEALSSSSNEEEQKSPSNSNQNYNQCDEEFKSLEQQFPRTRRKTQDNQTNQTVWTNTESQNRQENNLFGHLQYNLTEPSDNQRETPKLSQQSQIQQRQEQQSNQQEESSTFSFAGAEANQEQRLSSNQNTQDLQQNQNERSLSFGQNNEPSQFIEMREESSFMSQYSVTQNSQYSQQERREFRRLQRRRPRQLSVRPQFRSSQTRVTTTLSQSSSLANSRQNTPRPSDVTNPNSSLDTWVNRRQSENHNITTMPRAQIQSNIQPQNRITTPTRNNVNNSSRSGNNFQFQVPERRNGSNHNSRLSTPNRNNNNRNTNLCNEDGSIGPEFLY